MLTAKLLPKLLMYLMKNSINFWRNFISLPVKFSEDLIFNSHPKIWICRVLKIKIRAGFSLNLHCFLGKNPYNFQRMELRVQISQKKSLDFCGIFREGLIPMTKSRIHMSPPSLLRGFHGRHVVTKPWRTSNKTPCQIKPCVQRFLPEKLLLKLLMYLMKYSSNFWRNFNRFLVEFSEDLILNLPQIPWWICSGFK